jgi:hypothetical protein
VVGWLVCIEGPDKGRSFEIRNGNNELGRDEHTAINISGDGKISRRQALVTYESRPRSFVLKEAGGANVMYHARAGETTSQPVRVFVELEDFDVIEMGDSKLLLRRLCGPQFDWKFEDRDPGETG